MPGDPDLRAMEAELTKRLDKLRNELHQLEKRVGKLERKERDGKENVEG
jgi:hypothetical protein